MAMHALLKAAFLSVGLPAAALAQNYPLVGAPPIPSVATQAAQSAMSYATSRDAEPRGEDGYRRPAYGFHLPSRWATETYFISDYRRYDLPRPAPGFGWSHYYDAVVLTDRFGRVYDWREGLASDSRHWRRHHRHYDRDDADRFDRPQAPHWDIAHYSDTDYFSAPTETTTTTTTPGHCVPKQTVSYVTEYWPAKSRARSASPRKEIPLHGS